MTTGITYAVASGRISSPIYNIMQKDIFERIKQSTGGPIGQYRDKAEGYFTFPKLEGELGPHMRFNGKEVLCWSLNNYLGLANHPEVRKTDAEASLKPKTSIREKYAPTSGATRLTSSTSTTSAT